MSRLGYFWIDLEQSCVDLCYMISYNIWIQVEKSNY